MVVEHDATPVIAFRCWARTLERILVLIQSKTAGLSPSLKGSFNMYRSLRGVEKIIFILTVIFGVLIVVNSLVIVLLS